MAAKHWTLLSIVAVAVVAAVLVQHQRHSRATVLKVLTAMGHASPHADHVVVGGRTFRLSHYRVRGAPLQAAVSTDTKGLNNGTGSIVRSRGKLELNWVYSPESGPWGVRFVDAGGHQVVITSSWNSARAVSDLAVRLAG